MLLRLTLGRQIPHSLVRVFTNCYLSFLYTMLQFIKRAAAITNPSSN